MADLTVLSPPSPGRVVADLFIRTAKTFITTFIGIMGTNAIDWTNLSSAKAALIAAAGAAGTVILNAILSWANTSTTPTSG